MENLKWDQKVDKSSQWQFQEGISAIAKKVILLKLEREKNSPDARRKKNFTYTECGTAMKIRKKTENVSLS